MSADPGNVSASAGASAVARGPIRWWIWLGLLTAGFFGIFACFPQLFFALGVAHYTWFLDTFALLASNDAITRGLDPYAPNPLDYFHRPHVYSHWWLYLRQLGLTRADTFWLGLTLVVSFLLVAWARLRPRGPVQLAWYLAVLCSPPVLLAVDRANNDLVVFLLLTPLVPCLLARSRGLRLAAPFLVMAAAMLKYYPAAAALVLLGVGDRKELRARLVITVLLLAVAGMSLARDLAGFGPLAPQPEGLLTLGATGLFQELGWKGWAPKALCAALAAAIAGLSWLRRPLDDWEPTSEQQSNWLHFLLGAVLLTGCFFTSMNFGYRWIYLIWLAPLLWELPRDSATPASVRVLARRTGWLMLVILWWSPFCCVIINRLIGVVAPPTIMKLAKYAFLLEQPMDWALFVCLLVFLTHFARRQLAVLWGRAV
jgi:hypothetical protein